MVAAFSTTGAIERASSEIVLMSAMQVYFRFELCSMCGIPEITVLGTPEDWRSIRRRVAAFSEFDLEWWTKPLLPILDQFVAASEGRVDKVFWQSLYKLNDNSGGPYVTGWVCTLFPYLNVQVFENDELRRVVRRNDFLSNWVKGMSAEFGGGPTTRDFLTGLSVAPFLWRYFDEVCSMDLVAGFVGVSQNPDSLALRPAIGWAVRNVVASDSVTPTSRM